MAQEDGLWTWRVGSRSSVVVDLVHCYYLQDGLGGAKERRQRCEVGFLAVMEDKMDGLVSFGDAHVHFLLVYLDWIDA